MSSRTPAEQVWDYIHWGVPMGKKGKARYANWKDGWKPAARTPSRRYQQQHRRGGPEMRPR